MCSQCNIAKKYKYINKKKKKQRDLKIELELWNLWKQEHATVLISRTRPARGPMDKYTQSHMESEEEYSIENYIEDILSDKTEMKKRIEEIYGNVNAFVQQQNEEPEELEELEEPEEPEEPEV